MTQRQTSIQAYTALFATGRLDRLQAEMYYWACTDGQLPPINNIIMRSDVKHEFQHVNLGDDHGRRLTELRDAGCFRYLYRYPNRHSTHSPNDAYELVLPIDELVIVGNLAEIAKRKSARQKAKRDAKNRHLASHAEALARLIAEIKKGVLPRLRGKGWPSLTKKLAFMLDEAQRLYPQKDVEEDTGIA